MHMPSMDTEYIALCDSLRQEILQTQLIYYWKRQGLKKTSPVHLLQFEFSLQFKNVFCKGFQNQTNVSVLNNMDVLKSWVMV